ncbi:MAG TPA: hypothetical protein VF238_09965 [Methylomirabilota bacterium]
MTEAERTRLEADMGRAGWKGGSQRLKGPMESSKGRSPVSNFTKSTTRRWVISADVP